MNSSKNNFYFVLFAISVMLALTLPFLIQDGMFMDALLYTCVSKHLANGLGTFWFPMYEYAGMSYIGTFHEHPPLVFGIQSIFFRVLGDSLYTERIYVLVTLFTNAYLITKIWKLTHQTISKNLYWLPIILWISIPVCFWSFQNNMNENTMGIFVLLTVYFYLKAVLSEKVNYTYLLLSAFSVFLASFSKGLPGFYPLVTPFLYFIAMRNISFKEMFKHSLLLLSIPLIIYSILFIIPESSESLSNYFFKRALLRINEVPTTDYRLFIAVRLANELIPPVALLTIIYALFRRKGMVEITGESKRLSVFFLFMGFAGSLPLMLTMVQKGFYFVPSLAFFGLGLAQLISEPMSNWSEKVQWQPGFKKFKVFAVMLFISVLVFTLSKIGHANRDKAKLHDVYLIGYFTKAEKVVGISEEMSEDWSFRMYLMRYFEMNTWTEITPRYFITYKNDYDGLPDGYKRVELPTNDYDLYRKVLGE